MTVTTGSELRQAEPAPSRPPERTALRPLTGLRFVAAFGVVLFHFWGPCLSEGPAPVYNIAKAGHVGVSLFFVLSGFILAYTYLAEDGRLLVSRRQFWAARVARVYPLYLFALLLDVPHFYLKWVGPVLRDGPTLQAGIEVAAVSASTLALLQSWTPGIAYLWNAPAWSISVEAFFYAVFPFLAASVTGWSKRSLLATVAGLWLVAMAVSCVGVLGEGQIATRENQILWDHTFGALPLFRLPEFLIGVAAGQHFVRTLAKRAACNSRRVEYGLWLSGAIILVVLAFSPFVPQRLLHNGLLAPAFAVLICCLAVNREVPGRLLGSRLLVLLGEASYAIYILQVPLHALARALARSASAVSVTATTAVESSTGFIVTFSAVLILASVAAMKLIEQPARKWLRQRFESPRTKQYPAKPLEGELLSGRLHHPESGCLAADVQTVRAIGQVMNG